MSLNAPNAPSSEESKNWTFDRHLKKIVNFEVFDYVKMVIMKTFRLLTGSSLKRFRIFEDHSSSKFFLKMKCFSNESRFGSFIDTKEWNDPFSMK